MAGIVVGPGEGERIRRHRVLVELPELEILELRFGPDFEGVDVHTHADHVDTFYVLEGEAEFTIDGEVLRAGPGTFVAAPVGLPHGFRVAGDGDLVLLNMHAPATGFVASIRD
ncbi:MAG TPA: cupin domain-containing protein [Gaiellaceae bacterium]|nr:cupin domain-containing protein [Gaiellaceae bacterium]